MLEAAKEEIPISANLDFIPDWHQEDPTFSGETALELLDDNNGNLIQKTDASPRYSKTYNVATFMTFC